MHTLTLMSSDIKAAFTFRHYKSLPSMRRAIKARWEETQGHDVLGACITDSTDKGWVNTVVFFADVLVNGKPCNDATKRILLHECTHAAMNTEEFLRSRHRLHGVDKEEFIAYTTVGLYCLARDWFSNKFLATEQSIECANEDLSLAVSRDNEVASTHPAR